MERLIHYLGTAAAFAFFVLIVAFVDQMPLPQSLVANVPTASSTLSVESGFTLPPLTLSSLVPTDTSVTSSTPTIFTTKKVVPKSSPTSVPVIAPVLDPVSPTVPSIDTAVLDTSASALRDALVNIVCYVPSGSGLHSITGSGVIIDSKGIILTNAHIAQYFLLTSRKISCTIRSGSPAITKYHATLIYISPLWIRTNADVLTQTAPSGTGQYDFAFLAITSSATSAALPSSFSFVPLATTPPLSGDPVIIASYGAQFLESNQIQSALFPTIVFGSVKEVFTFTTTTVDVIALGGSAAAQEGSSGGGVASASGELVGTITTSTTKGATDTRSLDAITTSYIRAEYASETGSALDLLLAKPTATAVVDFAPRISELESILTAYLP